MRIKQRANNLARKHRTRDPYEIASNLRIEIIREPLRRIHGFCDRILRRKFIIINSNLPAHQQKQTCASELGHILLHKGWGYYFMLEHTLFAPGQFEREANEFAWHLLFDEGFCQYHYDGDIDRYIREEGIAELAKYAKEF